ncbi:MAG: guanine deaminase [Proteobacteria bacterium]|nr:MAG: guanine deaminase [Pseudomonadota bacterium]
MSNNVAAIRGSVLTYKDDPFLKDLSECMVYESDAIIIMADGKITDFGPATALKDKVPSGTEVKHYKDCLITAGFIDCHVHYPQTEIIGAFGKQLIDWLNKYTFVAEQSFSDKGHAREVSKVFLQECLRNGTTTSTVYCTVYPQSVDAFFEESEKLGMRNIAGKIMMDRNAPEALTDTPQKGYDETKALIEKWHEKGRQLYCVTPRFAPTSSPEQMEMTGAVWQEHSGTYLQSHISENKGEVAWVNELYPDRAGYLDVYDHYKQLGPRAIYGHGIHLTESELQRCYDSGTAIAHCPTSNLFLGSGLFNVQNAKKAERPVRVGLATDLGAGTSFSILQTLNEAYKVAQMNGYPLSAGHAFYLGTRGTAHALYLEDKIGSIAPGMEADLVVLDLNSTPIIKYRMGYCKDLDETLFVLMTMGDDRATRATYVNGTLAYEKGAALA